MIVKLIATLLVFAGVLVLSASPSGAQQSGGVFRVGVLMVPSAQSMQQRLGVFHQTLRELGYDKNLVIESRFADGAYDRLPVLAGELAGLKMDVFFVAGEPALLTAKEKGENIPIVVVSCDPLEKLLGRTSAGRTSRRGPHRGGPLAGPLVFGPAASISPGAHEARRSVGCAAWRGRETFARARWTQGLSDWMGAQVDALRAIGGVLKAIVCDNLKAGVTANAATFQCGSSIPVGMNSWWIKFVKIDCASWPKGKA